MEAATTSNARTLHIVIISVTMGINKNSVVLYKIQSIKLIKTCFVGVRITKSTELSRGFLANVYDHSGSCVPILVVIRSLVLEISYQFSQSEMFGNYRIKPKKMAW